MGFSFPYPTSLLDTHHRYPSRGTPGSNKVVVERERRRHILRNRFVSPAPFVYEDRRRCSPMAEAQQRRQPMETTIRANNGVMTLINVFVVDPENQQKLVAVLKEGTEALM